VGNSVSRRGWIVTVLALAVVFGVAWVLGGCRGAKTTSTSGAAAGGTAALSPVGEPVEESIAAVTGGVLHLTTPEGAQAEVVFPRGALAQDADVSASPLAGGKESGAIIGGFSLEPKGTGAGPKLVGPALIYFKMKGDPGARASIVSYRADGSFDPVPTTVASKDGTSVLMAHVTHFSGYGVRTLTADQQKAGDARRAQEVQAFDWVVYVKDGKSVTKNGMKSTLTLNLRAANTGGDIAGSYKATAKGTASNVWSGGLLVETFSVKIPAFTFTLNPYFEMPPLTEGQDEGGLAPLDTAVDFQGYGSMTLTATGKGTAHVSGRNVAVPVKPKTSQAKFTISVFGPQLRMTVTDATGATYYLDGYVRGEAK
jgi:hypothetical protein